MEIFKLRNVALGCFAFLVSLYISNILNNTARVIFSVSAVILFSLLLILYAIFKKDKILKYIIRLSPVLLGIFLAFFTTVFTFGNDEKIENYFGESYETILDIEEVEYESSYESVYIAKTQKIGETDFKTEIYLTTTGGNLTVGDRIKANISYSELESYYLTDKESIFVKGVRAEGTCEEEYEVISHSDNIIKSSFNNIREFLKSHLADSVNDETYQIISAVLLGDKTELDQNIKRDFSRVGISHILALSGMHISLIITLIGFIMSLLPLPKKLKIFIIIVFTSLFVGITGMSDSAMRAGIMVIIFNLLLMLRVDADHLTSLFLAVALICLFSPYSIFSLSLLLSFTALIACICSGKLIHRVKLFRKIRFKPIRYVIFTLITTTSVNIFTLPIMFWYYGSVSLVSPLANLITVPIFTIILYLSPFLIVFSKIAFLKIPLAFILEKLVHFSLYIVGKVASLKYVVIPISGNVEGVAIILLIIAVLSVLLLSRKKVKFALMGICFSICIFASGAIYGYVQRYNESAFDVYQVGTKKSDFMAMESENCLTVVYFGSNSQLKNAYYLASYLEYTEIENLVVFEYDKYLANRFDNVSDATYVRNLYITEPSEDDKEIFDEIEKIAKDKSINIKFIENTIDLGKISVDVSINAIPRSTKSIISISALSYNSRFTYLGASSFELLDSFASDFAYISDVVVFGSYGPNYKVYYNYDMPYLDYCVFLGDSKEYAKIDFTDNPSSKILGFENLPIRFVFN